MFVIYITFLLSSILIYIIKETQIILIFTKKIEILIKYLDFFNKFLRKRALKLLEIINLNQYTINLENSKQLLYKPIYS